MPGVQTLAPGIVDSLSTPALSKIPANFRVTASGQPIGVIGDVVTFSGLPTLTGTWMMGSLRATVNGLPVINQTAQGVSVTSVGAPGGPIFVQTPDTRVSVG
jgi:hypothetical protein